MVTEYEAAKLRREMDGELDGSAGTMLKCTVGIVMVVLLAIVSPTLGLEHDGDGAGAAAQSSTAVARR